jgi:hypothetical protein
MYRGCVPATFFTLNRELQYKRSPSVAAKIRSHFEFSLLLVQLRNKTFFSMKETLRPLVNRASIGFVQERNLHVRLSLCRSIESSSTSAVECKLRAHERTTAHPAGIFARRFVASALDFLRKGKPTGGGPN